MYNVFYDDGDFEALFRIEKLTDFRYLNFNDFLNFEIFNERNFQENFKILTKEISKIFCPLFFKFQKTVKISTLDAVIIHLMVKQSSNLIAFCEIQCDIPLRIEICDLS